MSAQFDAFISYARSSSTALAEKLQQALEKYDRKWYQARSIRVFRDDSSLSASASLGGPISEALQTSKFLILILSPAAAQREWVAREVEEWLSLHGPDTILLVHHQGKVGWNSTPREAPGFSPESTAVPPVLASALRQEPRWVDFTWFDDAPEGAHDPRFELKAVELYSAVTGRAVDEVRASNDRKVRHAKRLARLGVALLSLLLVVSLIATFVAIDQARVANERTRTAVARQLASKSSQLLDRDIGLARLAAVQAWEMVDEPSTRAALLRSATSAPELAGQAVFEDLVTQIVVSADGDRAAVLLANGSVWRWDTTTGETRRVPGDSFSSINMDDSGRFLVANAENSYVMDTDGSSVRSEPGSALISTDGAWLAVSSGDLAILDTERSFSDVIANNRAVRLDCQPVAATAATLTCEQSGVFTTFSLPDLNQLSSRATYEHSRKFLAPVSADGRWFFNGRRLLDLTKPLPEGESLMNPLDGVSINDDPGEFGAAGLSPDGGTLVQQIGGTLHVVDGGSGKRITILSGARGVNRVSVGSRAVFATAQAKLATLWKPNQQGVLTKHSSSRASALHSFVRPSPDGATIAMYGSLDSTVLRDRASGTESLVNDVKHLVWRDSDSWFGVGKGGLRLWSKSGDTSEQIADIPVADRTFPGVSVQFISYSPESGQLVFDRVGGRVTVDTQTGDYQIADPPAHAEKAPGMPGSSGNWPRLVPRGVLQQHGLSPNGELAFIATRRGFLTVLDARDGSFVADLRMKGWHDVAIGFSEQAGMAFTISYETDETPGLDGYFDEFDLRPRAWRDTVCQSSHRKLTAEDWTSLVGEEQPVPNLLACS